MTPERWQTVERLYHAALSSARARAGSIPERRLRWRRCAASSCRRAADTPKPGRGLLEAPAWHSVAAALVEPTYTGRVGRVIGSFESSRISAAAAWRGLRARDAGWDATRRVEVF